LKDDFQRLRTQLAGPDPKAQDTARQTLRSWEQNEDLIQMRMRYLRPSYGDLPNEEEKAWEQFWREAIRIEPLRKQPSRVEPGPAPKSVPPVPPVGR
jgi:hypothetical protein